MLHFQFRYLDPRVGRWVSFDPLFVRLEQETIEKYAEFNGYAYVSNNPLNSVDPLGLCKGDNCPKKDGKKTQKTSAGKRDMNKVDRGTLKQGEKQIKQGDKANKLTEESNKDARAAQADNLTEAKRANKASEKANSIAQTSQVQNLEQAKRANTETERANKASEKQADRANDIALANTIVSGITSALAGLTAPAVFLFGDNLFGTGK